MTLSGWTLAGQIALTSDRCTQYTDLFCCCPLDDTASDRSLESIHASIY